MSLALIGMPGHWELILILVIVMIFFGVGKLPEVGKALGASIKQFKNAQKDDSIDVTGQLDDQSGSFEPTEERERRKV